MSSRPGSASLGACLKWRASGFNRRRVAAKGSAAGPVVIVANHPFGIGDGIAILSLAEQLGRPFKVLVNNELLKIEEMRDYALPISFEETKAALATNLKTRQEALSFSKKAARSPCSPPAASRPRRRALAGPRICRGNCSRQNLSSQPRHRSFLCSFTGRTAAFSPRQQDFADLAAFASCARVQASVRQDNIGAHWQRYAMGRARRAGRPETAASASSERRVPGVRKHGAPGQAAVPAARSNAALITPPPPPQHPHSVPPPR